MSESTPLTPEARTLLDDPGPRSALATTSMVLGLVPFTFFAGLVLSIISFFRLSMKQNRAQAQTAIGFGAGLGWGILGLLAFTLLVH